MAARLQATVPVARSAAREPAANDSLPPLDILLTGGTGFIGSQLAQSALKLGHRITVASPANNETERFRCALLARAGISVIDAGLHDRERLRAALAGRDVVIHLAAAQHEAEAPESHFRKVNVDGTRNLLELACEAGVRRFVHGSTIGVYGQASTGVLDEDSPPAPDSAYGRTKLEAEHAVAQFATRLETAIVRISEAYGPGDMRLLKLFRAIDRGRYVTIGAGRNERQLIYVDDLCRGLLAAAHLRAAVGQTMILAGSERLTTDDVASGIGSALGKSRVVRHVPLWPFDFAATVMETCLPPLGIKPPLHRRRLDYFRKSFRFSTQRAQSLLDFRPEVSFVEGARRTAEWYRTQALL
jgi:nucleoside-diphosphate-sugar epimerase